MSLIATEDMIVPFQLESCAVRGRLVRLGPALDTILGQHRLPLKVAALLAEATPIAAALGTSLKFDGIFTIQTQTDGTVRRLVVDVTSDGAVRACAQFDAQRLADLPQGESLLGRGHLVLTVDQKLSDERYQGIVQIDGDNLVEAFQLYFRQSEQIPTGLFVAARISEEGAWHSGCLMVQRMPQEGGAPSSVNKDTAVEDDWLRLMALMQTCTKAELTDPALAPSDLLFRLFHEEGVRVYDTVPLRHECRCSREKIKGILDSMPPDEIKSMRQEDGTIAVTCQFCGLTHKF